MWFLVKTASFLNFVRPATGKRPPGQTGALPGMPRQAGLSDPQGAKTEHGSGKDTATPGSGGFAAQPRAAWRGRIRRPNPKAINTTWLVFAFLWLAAMPLQAQPIPPKPNPPKAVNDLANMLSVAEENELTIKLNAYFDSTSTQIVVVTMPDLGGYAASDIALGILRTWGVGEKGEDNGIVFLVSRDDRKVRIEVGYGLEGAIPDGLAGTVIRQEVIPNFKKGLFGAGITAGVDAIIKAASGEYKNTRSKDTGNPLAVVLILLAIVVVVMFIMYRLQKRHGRGTLVTRRGYTDWDRGPRPPTIFWGSGPNWPGGGGGGFGGGGGGFDFGGGSGGGGGADGSW
jgi:uncharacterized protein